MINLLDGQANQRIADPGERVEICLSRFALNPWPPGASLGIESVGTTPANVSQEIDGKH